MTIQQLDPRLHAFRNDLADRRLRGQVEASHFADGELRVVASPVADMRTQPSSKAGLGTQLLVGDRVRVFDADQGWAWAQAERDRYVGYVHESVLGMVRPDRQGTHRIAVPRTFTYTGPDLKRPAVTDLPMGALVTVAAREDNRGTTYARLIDGSWCIDSQLCAKDQKAEDYVAVAESLLRTPYLWGGASAFGIDCSGLVQLSLLMAGRAAPRDSDMQEAELGEVLGDDEDLRRGDLVFWKGHVGIMRDGKTLLHANAHTMDVTTEPLSEAIDRIAHLYGQPTAYRRP